MITLFDFSFFSLHIWYNMNHVFDKIRLFLKAVLLSALMKTLIVLIVIVWIIGMWNYWNDFMSIRVTCFSIFENVSLVVKTVEWYFVYLFISPAYGVSRLFISPAYAVSRLFIYLFVLPAYAVSRFFIKRREQDSNLRVTSHWIISLSP